MRPTRTKLGFALAIAVSAVLASAATASGARPAGTIESGAGPGWPRTVSPNDFVPRVTNPWFPLEPGSVWHYAGFKQGIRQDDTVRVTLRTKTILSVATTVVHDVVTVNGRPEEVTDDFYAQDRDGNVWYFGEETEELNAQGKRTSTEGSFEAGVDGARPGVLIPGNPTVGKAGRQEYLEGVAEDHFRVLAIKTHVSVSFISTNGALRTREWTPLEPGAVDNKFYVRGVGVVREIAVKGPLEKLELLSFKSGSAVGH